MSNYSGLLPNMRQGPRENYPLAGFWPAVADSYNPIYITPQTLYGACDCQGGALTRNNCNFQQGGYRPQCLANGLNCRCTNASGTDSGCFNQPGAPCL